VADDLERTLRVLAQLRDELRRSYPLVDRARLRRVLRKSRLSSWPEAFLVGRAPTGGALATLYRRLGGSPRVASHPLFSADFYRFANPDIAAGNVDPWLHYQVYGRLEGRSPHPFVDLNGLARQLDGEPIGSALDRYLSDRRAWVLSPGPYVDVESFVAEGPWDGRTHPLVQILRDYPTDPWVRLRLGTIDLGSAAGPAALALAAGLLALRNPGLAATSGLSSWTRGRPAEVTAGEPLRVVPGFFVGAAGGEVAATGGHILSADATVVRTPELVVALDAGAEHQCERLVFLFAETPPAETDRLLAAAGPDDLVAPATEGQAERAAARDRRALVVGRQATVVARSLELAAGSSEVGA
jgi:hypothetical protein